MGYTHYTRQYRDFTAEEWECITADVEAVLEHCKSIVGDYEGNGGTPQVNPDIVQFNGIGDQTHESFTIRRVIEKPGHFDFCKTARKPYDLAVTACLIVVDHYVNAGETRAMQISSDGNREDWEPGIALAQTLFGYGQEFDIWSDEED